MSSSSSKVSSSSTARVSSSTGRVSSSSTARVSSSSTARVSSSTVRESSSVCSRAITYFRRALCVHFCPYAGLGVTQFWMQSLIESLFDSLFESQLRFGKDKLQSKNRRVDGAQLLTRAGIAIACCPPTVYE